MRNPQEERLIVVNKGPALLSVQNGCGTSCVFFDFIISCSVVFIVLLTPFYRRGTEAWLLAKFMQKEVIIL